MSKISLLLIDDHTVLRSGLKLMLNAQPDMNVVAESDNIADALRLAGEHRPDVLLLDLTLPGGASLPLISQLKQHQLPTHVLVLTMHDDPAYVRAALSAGAIGYVTKTVGDQALLAAIRSVRQGRVFVDLDDPAKTASVFNTLIAPRPSRMPEWKKKLSEREAEVLLMLGRGMTNQAIADHLAVSPKTVATYRARIAEKLGLKSTADFVKYAVDVGLVSPESMQRPQGG